MNIQITLNRESQIILAEGHGRRWTGRRALAAGILFGLVLLFGGLWFGLSRPLSIPNDTAVIAVLPPQHAKNLIPSSLWDRLPLICRQAWSGNSDWPAICGMSVSGQAFAIVPRWIDLPGQPHIDAGLVSRYGDTPNDSQNLSYTQTLMWRGFAKQPVIHFESKAVELLSGLDGTTSTAINFNWNGQAWVSELSLKPAKESLPNADIALRITDQAWQAPARELFISAAGLPDRESLKKLPTPDVYAAWLTPEGNIERRYLGFSRDLKTDEAAHTLGMVGVTERRQITLPDGTTSFERLLPIATTGTDFFGRRTNDRGETVDLTPRGLMVSNTSTAFDLTNIVSCGNSPTVFRISSEILEHLISAKLPSLQAFSDNGKLAICFE